MQEYAIFVRAVFGGRTVVENDGSVVVQNAGEAQAYLNEYYLSQGYKILSVDYLGTISFANDKRIPEGGPEGLRFAWHLVKEVE